MIYLRFDPTKRAKEDNENRFFIVIFIAGAFLLLATPSLANFINLNFFSVLELDLNHKTDFKKLHQIVGGTRRSLSSDRDIILCHNTIWGNILCRFVKECI